MSRSGITLLLIVLTACSGDAARHDRPPEKTESAARPREREDPAVAARRRAALELQSLEQRRADLSSRIDEQKESIAASERTVARLKRDLRRRKAATDAYIDQHQFQVACAYADQVANSTSGEWSEQTKRCASVASIYCTVAMLSGSFRRKVAAVKQHVDQAGERSKSLRAETKRLGEEIKAARAKLRASQEAFERTSSEATALRRKLQLPPPSEVADGMEPYSSQRIK